MDDPSTNWSGLNQENIATLQDCNSVYKYNYRVAQKSKPLPNKQKNVLKPVNEIRFFVKLKYESSTIILFVGISGGRSGLVVTRLPAARADPGSNRAADRSLCFHENHCDSQLWARAAH